MDSVSLVRFALILCAIWDPRRTEAANVIQNKFLSGVDLEILKNTIGKNTVVSSFAFRLPLCRLAATAAPNTSREIISVLNIQTVKETKTCFSGLFPIMSLLLETDLTMVNKIYVNFTSDIDDAFILSSRDFGLSVSKIGFSYRKAAVDYVNQEFSTKTYMRIRDVLEVNDINQNSSILLVNGFHYKGTWESPLQSSKTRVQQFRSGNRTIQIEMMKSTIQCFYLDKKDAYFKAISLHLSQRGVLITLVLPYTDSKITNLLDHFSGTPNFMQTINDEMHWKFVSVAIPKIKIKTTSDWTPYLKQIGLNLTMSKNNTGLNSILKKGSSSSNMYVSKAKQRLFVELDEGAKANKYMRARDQPQMRQDDAAVMQEYSPVKLETFNVDGPVYFSVAMVVPSTNPKQKPRLHQIFHGTYYGPE